jgi:DnaJ-domain-containing protein 1
LDEEKATLEEMVESHDELLLEIAREMGLDRMGEDENEEEEEEDADDGGDAAAPPFYRTTTSSAPYYRG